MTPNEIMIVQSCQNLTKLLTDANKRLLELVQLQLGRENNIIVMSKEEYLKHVVDVMDFVTPIVTLLAKE